MLQLGSGVLISVPIPEEASPHGEEVEEAVQLAVTEAKCVRVAKQNMPMIHVAICHAVLVCIFAVSSTIWLS